MVTTLMKTAVSGCHVTEMVSHYSRSLHFGINMVKYVDIEHLLLENCCTSMNRTSLLSFQLRFVDLCFGLIRCS